MMDCAKFQEVLADLDRPGVLPAALRESAFAHAEGCGDCGQLLTETELLDAELRRLAARDRDLHLPSGLEAKLLNAFRQRNSVAERKTAWRYATAIGIAAVLLLSVGFWLNWRTTGSNRLPSVKVSAPALAVGAAASASNTAPSVSGYTNPRQIAATPPAVIPNTRGDASDDALVSEPDTTAGFIPLPDADPGPLEDGAVVRVEMSRAALASFGLPLEAMEGSGTVRADLIVSSDGTPQAIRLLSQNDATAAQQ